MRRTGVHERRIFGIDTPSQARCTCRDEPQVSADKPCCPIHSPKGYSVFEAKHRGKVPA